MVRLMCRPDQAQTNRLGSNKVTPPPQNCPLEAKGVSTCILRKLHPLSGILGVPRPNSRAELVILSRCQTCLSALICPTGSHSPGSQTEWHDVGIWTFASQLTGTNQRLYRSL